MDISIGLGNAGSKDIEGDAGYAVGEFAGSDAAFFGVSDGAVGMDLLLLHVDRGMACV